MADHFEKAKDDILFRTEGNGGPTPRDILTAIGALADDVDEQHKESITKITDATAAMTQHLKEAAHRDERIGDIEVKMSRYEEECPARLEAVIGEAVRRSTSAHGETHAQYVASITKPRRKGDKNGDDHRKEREESRQVWLMWKIGEKITYVLLAVLITALNILVHYLLMGEP